jgi:tetratricopeptide (TPR) repeat protein
MRRLSYNAVCGIVLTCLFGGYLASFFFVRRLRPREFKKELSAINSLYEKGDYKRCVIAYENLASRYNIQCMTLFYNLANAYCQRGDLGHAILYYKKAQKLAPRDREVGANLRIAQARARVTIRPDESRNNTESLGRKVVRLFSFFEGVAASLTFRWLLVGCVVLAVFFGHQRRWLIRLSIVLAVLFYLSVGATVYKAYVQKSYRQAVVVVQDCPVRKKPNRSEVTAAVLREGTTVEIKNRRNGWYRIALGDGKLGWIREDYLEEI